MAGILASIQNRDAVRVKVKKCEGYLLPEYRKFSVDPQITSFEVLRSLLSRAFDIKGEFTIGYMARDENCSEGRETFVPLLSDWDLDAAFLAASEPHLSLRVDCKPVTELGISDDWDVISQPPDAGNEEDVRRAGIAGSILNQVERTLTMVQRAALSLVDGEKVANNRRVLAPPMADAEFRRFLDSEGKVVRPVELRRCVFRAGLDPALRRVAWKHVLNVYPEGLTGRERVEYVRRKGNEYYRLRTVWQEAVRSGLVSEEMRFVTNMVRKDVLRTDRSHKFYAGSDDNANVVSLFNLLATYALNHPSVSYCQGMSDLASPLLVVMSDEAQAYVCFCALMKRLRPNFLLDGEAMSLKFLHLADALKSYDPVFFSYLQQRQADDLLFCYRWLLLEMKREFAFDDALRMLEVLWSSLPQEPPDGELALFEVEFRALSVDQMPRSPKSQTKETAYTKVRAIRRQSSGSSIAASRRDKDNGVQSVSSDDCDGVSTPDRQVARGGSGGCPSGGCDESVADVPDRDLEEGDIRNTAARNGTRVSASSSSSSVSSEMSVFGELSTMTNSCEEALESDEVRHRGFRQRDVDVGCDGGEKERRGFGLVPPNEFGGGNPFLMFLCLTLLLQHRDHIVAHRMDYNELAMHFDKMVRKHDVTRVLQQARAMFAEYLGRVACLDEDRAV